MKVDAISIRHAERDTLEIQARVSAGFGAMAPLADETGRAINFAPTEAEMREAMRSHRMADLDQRVTANVQRAHHGMTRCRELFPVP